MWKPDSTVFFGFCFIFLEKGRRTVNCVGKLFKEFCCKGEVGMGEVEEIVLWGRIGKYQYLLVYECI